jgi:hypothetical protein
MDLCGWIFDVSWFVKMGESLDGQCEVIQSCLAAYSEGHSMFRCRRQSVVRDSDDEWPIECIENRAPMNRRSEDIEIVFWIKDRMIELDKSKADVPMKLIGKC